ncbi:hypothetical protein DERP_007741 [Dermatophagoides pteronyssinus]|uniref:Uncharacterized protein n=1 Tax=Dermatophagoides pteronyssinus TaxID=6956 RepID=A0ABQ8JL47_DERPT|nr:hypothetical protein DERP_007741 [Dermatophagoides pteronyssinus]
MNEFFFVFALNLLALNKIRELITFGWRICWWILVTGKFCPKISNVLILPSSIFSFFREKQITCLLFILVFTPTDQTIKLTVEASNSEHVINLNCINK